MENNKDQKIYIIKIRGRLDMKWADWFGGMKVEYDDKYTIISGPVADQAALHGMLDKIRDLNFTLINVECVND